MRKVAISLIVILMMTGCSSFNVYKNNKSSFGQNDLMRAVYYDDMDTFKLQVKKKSALTETDASGATILHYIARYGTKKMAQSVLMQGGIPLLDKKGGIRNNTPLQEALMEGNTEVAKVFYQFYSNKGSDQIDDAGRSLLHLAYVNEQHDMVTELLQHGADPNVQDNDGNTPIHLFLYCLKENHCDEYTRNIRFSTPDLIKYGFDPNLENKDGESVREILDNRKGIDVLRPANNLDRNVILLRTAFRDLF